MKENAIEKWNKTWDAKIHLTEHAVQRIKSAKSAKLTPIKIDNESLYGYFRGLHGHYETWLDDCSCADFKRYRLPCKHIYRLAIELQILNEKVATNSSMIPQLKKEKVSLSKTIDIIEMLSENAQRQLCDIARNATTSEPKVYVNSSETIEELMQSGLLVCDGNIVNGKVKFGTKTDIARFLASHGIRFLKSDSKVVLENICLSEIPEETKNHFGIIRSFNVLIPDCFSRQNIHYYLHRKYDFSDCVDDDGNSILRIKTELPDDKITEELIKRGYYHPDEVEHFEAGRIVVKLSTINHVEAIKES